MARSTDYIGATGIGVSDLERSAAFYRRALGMRQIQTFKLDYMDEIVLGHEGRNAVVLMHYTDGSNPNYKNLPVKLVFYVSDPKAVAARIRAEGCEIIREPAPIPTLSGAVVGLARDPDGYVVELLQAPVPKTAETDRKSA
ncbi:MAG TPA: VOC family protein [Rhizomicrobium sp.]|nr:VOC family protein [Rhizomicrobium sp.]